MRQDTEGELKRELKVFLIVGCLTVLVDFTLYRSLLATHLFALNVAKALGFIGGTFFAYFANRTWTFQQRPPLLKSFQRFSALYLFTLSANVIINAWSLKQFSGYAYTVPLAFLLATSLSASLNFVGMKFLVFTSSPAKEIK